MKKILALLLFSSSLFACDEIFKSYPLECSLQDRFIKTKQEFNKLGVNHEYLSAYRTIRFISRKAYESHLKEKKDPNPQMIYKPAPLTWDIWEQGAIYADSGNIDWSKELSLETLKDLHENAIVKEIMTKASTILKGARPGKMRSRHTQMAPGFKISCEDKTSIQDLEFILNYDLEDSKGNKLVRLHPKSDVNYSRGGVVMSIDTKYYSICKDRNYGHGFFLYLESAKVPFAINEWLEMANEGLGKIRTGKKMDVSPVEFMADLQRRFISIHPFGDGNGRTSRFIQDSLLKSLNLPIPASSDISNDLFSPTKKYRQMMVESIKGNMSYLERCLKEHQSGKVSLECTELK
jgi:hypothetical protein